MFHLFNDVYLELDAAFTSLKYENIAISNRWADITFFDPALKTITIYNTFDDFVNNALNARRQDFWSHLYSKKHPTTRLVVYVDPNLYVRLQVEYWKGIFKNPTPDALYQLHKLYVQDCWFKSFLYDENAHTQGRIAYRALEVLPRAEFDEIVEIAPVNDFLRNLSKKHVSFEYQLANYLLDENTPLATTVLDKVKSFTWANWVQELEVLKADLINAGVDINRVLPEDQQIDVSSPSALFNSITQSEYVNWIIDPNVHYSNPSYVEASYDKEIFKHLYTKFYTVWSPEGEGVVAEDMSELIDLIYGHQYAELLTRDIARGFGCVYGAGRYRLRMNQSFLSWTYSVKRSGDTSPLAAYELA